MITSFFTRAALAVFAVLLVVGLVFWFRNTQQPEHANGTAQQAAQTEQPLAGLCRTFRCEVIEEAPASEESVSDEWWVDSGAYAVVDGKELRTLQGDLPRLSPWRFAYALSNPADTNDGYRPQNLLRLITRRSFREFSGTLYAKISRYDASPSPNRNESNGILILARYKDADSLYLAGVRVDGAVVIKKKSGGVYYTLAYREHFATGPPYQRDTNPLLLPADTWLGIKMRVEDTSGGGVDIHLLLDQAGTGVWVPALEATDDGIASGSPPLVGEGRAGIRTDFMDVSFKNINFNSL